ncbi:hypothetical protein J2Y03_004869 [Neobacillus niacini]|uniref:hypothetical protein n=1 Tax=Neobacillus niacini TaxID=86668 RepID=UPI00286445CB|nr:hypothetical protein [Neobacillus niacini]MDR7079811.1 hypothetical protein [Neobacillus niacini]
MDNVIAISKLVIEKLLSLNISSLLLGVLIGVYVTYKLTIDRNRIMEANDAYKTVYGSLFIKLSTIKINIEIKKKEFGERNFRKLNKQNKKNRNITLIAKQILDVSDDIHKMVNIHDQDKLSMIVISRYFAVEKIKEQIRILEISMLELGEEEQYRENRIARLNYELACAKISFAQGILADIQKILKVARINDREMKKNIKFLLKTCRAAKKKEVSKRYGIEKSKNVKIYDAKKKTAG